MEEINGTELLIKGKIQRIAHSKCFVVDNIDKYISSEFAFLFHFNNINSVLEFEKYIFDNETLFFSNKDKTLKSRFCREIKQLYVNIPSFINDKLGWVVYFASQIKIINKLNDNQLSTPLRVYPNIKRYYISKFLDNEIDTIGFFKNKKISELVETYHFSNAELLLLSDILFFNGITDIDYIPPDFICDFKTIDKKSPYIKFERQNYKNIINELDKLVSEANQLADKEEIKSKLSEINDVVTILKNNGKKLVSDKSENTIQSINTNKAKARELFYFDSNIISNIEASDPCSLSALINRINESYNKNVIRYSNLISFLIEQGLYEKNTNPEIRYKYVPTEDGKFNGIDFQEKDNRMYILLNEKAQRIVLLSLKDFEHSKFNSIY